MSKKVKCRTKGCKRMIDPEYIYCSFECGAYDGVFGIKTGWDHEKIKANKEYDERQKK